MPRPAKGETKNNYISRCIRVVRQEGEGQKQAVGKCFGMWKHYTKKKHSRKRKKKNESVITSFEKFINENYGK